MTNTYLSMTEPAPLNYRYALDAALTILPIHMAMAVQCDIPALMREVRWRIPNLVDLPDAHAVLWVEPFTSRWHKDLTRIGETLPDGALLAIVASRPLARLLPERRLWWQNLIGTHLGGMRRMCTTIRRAGFTLEASYGIHSVRSIGFGILGRQADHWNRPDLADQFHAAARLHYCVTGLASPLSTIALIVARKKDC